MIFSFMVLLTWSFSHFKIFPFREIGIGASAPFAQGSTASKNWFVRRIDDLRDKNKIIRNLESRLRDQELELAKSRVNQKRFSALMKQLSLPKFTDWYWQTTAVLGRDPVSWKEQFRINLGSHHGIREGYAVMSGGYIIGSISSCDKFSSVVSTVASAKCSFSVRMQDSDALGILHGGIQKNGECIIDFLERDMQFKEGELVVSSGMGKDIPGGLKLGILVKWNKKELVHIVDGAYAQAKVKLVGEYINLRFVSVACPTNALKQGIFCLSYFKKL